MNTNSNQITVSRKSYNAHGQYEGHRPVTLYHTRYESHIIGKLASSVITLAMMAAFAAIVVWIVTSL